MKKYCGYIAFVGRPNAGKSTMVNALVGQKVAGVSRKPQTTRNRILGILTSDDYQLLFLDTPGIHRAGGYAAINAMMNREAFTAVEEADVVIYTIDLTEGWTSADRSYLSQLKVQEKGRLRVFLTKADAMKKAVVAERVRDITAELHGVGYDGSIKTVSAKRPDSLREVLDELKAALPEGPFQFAEDDVTDRSTNFLVGELIRETIFRSIGQELPYDSAVVVESFTKRQDLVAIQANIFVARESQKGMVVGKKGVKIREIGVESRKKLEDFLGEKVYLDLHVKVRDGWTKDRNAISELTDITF